MQTRQPQEVVSHAPYAAHSWAALGPSFRSKTSSGEALASLSEAAGAPIDASFPNEYTSTESSPVRFRNTTRWCAAFLLLTGLRSPSGVLGAPSMGRNHIDITGQRFCRLTVKAFVAIWKHRSFWECLCDCGNIVTVSRVHLRSGHTRSCGCIRFTGRKPSALRKRIRTQRERLRALWSGILRRCLDQSSNTYASYGGRGITVCDAWRIFGPFENWAISNGWRLNSGLQIDRRDNNGPYSPNNCRFVTAAVNNRNRRDNRLITAFGETKCLAAWGDDPRRAVTLDTISHRLSSGKWSPEEAISALSHTKPSSLSFTRTQ
jgi:hypothetical protein